MLTLIYNFIYSWDDAPGDHHLGVLEEFPFAQGHQKPQI